MVDSRKQGPTIRGADRPYAPGWIGSVVVPSAAAEPPYDREPDPASGGRHFNDNPLAAKTTLKGAEKAPKRYSAKVPIDILQ